MTQDSKIEAVENLIDRATSYHAYAFGEYVRNVAIPKFYGKTGPFDWSSVDFIFFGSEIVNTFIKSMGKLIQDIPPERISRSESDLNIFCPGKRFKYELVSSDRKHICFVNIAVAEGGRGVMSSSCGDFDTNTILYKRGPYDVFFKNNGDDHFYIYNPHTKTLVDVIDPKKSTIFSKIISKNATMTEQYYSEKLNCTANEERSSDDAQRIRIAHRVHLLNKYLLKGWSVTFPNGQVIEAYDNDPTHHGYVRLKYDLKRVAKAPPSISSAAVVTDPPVPTIESLATSSSVSTTTSSVSTTTSTVSITEMLTLVNNNLLDISSKLDKMTTIFEKKL